MPNGSQLGGVIFGGVTWRCLILDFGNGGEAVALSCGEGLSEGWPKL